MSKLTILLTLKDRSIYTERWIRCNVFSEFQYYIDGSLTDENEKIFKKFYHQNNYVRYPPDNLWLTIPKKWQILRKYWNKICNGS